MARAERGRLRDGGFFFVTVVVELDSIAETLDFGRLSLREGEARPQSRDALGKISMLLFLLCERGRTEERAWKPSCCARDQGS